VAGDGELLGEPLTLFAMRFLALALVGCGATTTAAPAHRVQYTLGLIASHANCTFGDDRGYTDDTLHVPTGAEVTLTISNIEPPTSEPIEIAIGTMSRSVASGAKSELEFVAGAPGQYAWSCDGRPHMMSVDDDATLDARLQRAYDESHPTTLDGRIALGHELYEDKGCVQCHTIDGSLRVGPSWKGIWGSTVRADSGTTRTVDAAYVRESIMTPQAFVVAAFPAVMPTFGGVLKDHEIDALTAFIESLE
jgi:cytochrome c oxidase subunit II